MAGVLRKIFTGFLIGATVVAVLLVANASDVNALNPLPTPPPAPGSYGLEAVKKQPAPTQGATVSVPSDGQSFSTSPITVSGLCPDDLLVQVYNNDVMVGSVMCENGSYSLEVGLFVGLNEIVAKVYDELGQEGPVSNTRTVNYDNSNFSAFGELITLTSAYGRRSASVNNALDWPLQLAGGSGPYAFSIDWGDGEAAQLLSRPIAGTLGVSHVYKKAGIYKVSIRVVDSQGVSAFMQVVAVSSGKVDDGAVVDDKALDGLVVKDILWWPVIILLLLLLPTYWLGRRSQLVSLRNKMIKERDQYEDRQISEE